MSSGQLSKLNIMVEKLLETATLDSEVLELNKDTVDLIKLLRTLVSRYKNQEEKKVIKTIFETEKLLINVDAFHFENALNNILDNAIKYGGDIILVEVLVKNNCLEIRISDNGNTLTKDSEKCIFEKFYRVPKGNKHDIKGFGYKLIC